LVNELFNHLIDILLVKVGDIDALLYTEIVPSHHGGLGIQALTDDEGEVWVLRLNVQIVVVDVLSTQDQSAGALVTYLIPLEWGEV